MSGRSGEPRSRGSLSFIPPTTSATRNNLCYHIRPKCSSLAGYFLQASVQIPDLEMVAVPSLGQSLLIYTWAVGCRSFLLTLQAGLALVYHKHI